MPVRGDMGSVVARLLEGVDEEEVVEAIHELERVVLSEPPGCEQEAVLMLQVVASGLRASDGAPDYVRAVEDVAAWIKQAAH